MSFNSEYLERGQVAEITPGKHKNVVTSKIPLVLNILLGRKPCSCEQINNIPGYFREDEQLPRRLNNVVRNFAHLRIFGDITCLPTVQARTHPIRPFEPLQLDIHVVQMSCHSATFALQRGCFVPREWLAAKGLFCMVAHNCHSKTKNLTAKTLKYLTAKPNTSQQKQKSFGFAVGICLCRHLVVEIVSIYDNINSVAHKF